ncbi:MAG: hypothetical protein EZS28_017905, partial [Streblomastix strix]
MLESKILHALELLASPLPQVQRAVTPR